VAQDNKSLGPFQPLKPTLLVRTGHGCDVRHQKVKNLIKINQEITLVK